MAHPTVNSRAAAHVAATAAAAIAAAALDAPAAASPPPPDLITVGGGTAGCTLAARLCAGLPDAHITLLKRGAPLNAMEELHVRAPRHTGATWAAPSLTAPFPLTSYPGLVGRPVTLLTGTTLSAARRRSMARSGPSRLPPWRACGGCGPQRVDRTALLCAGGAHHAPPCRRHTSNTSTSKTGLMQPPRRGYPA